jgi:hypothetical protein
MCHISIKVVEKTDGLSKNTENQETLIMHNLFWKVALGGKGLMAGFCGDSEGAVREIPKAYKS